MKFLSTQMAPSDLVAVMTYATALNVLQDFTNDRDLLAKTIQGLPVGDTGMANGSTGSDTEGDTGAAYTPTIPNSTSSTPTASWPRSNPR